MTVREKIKTIDNKMELNKTHFNIDIKKTLRFLLYHQEILANMNF